MEKKYKSLLTDILVFALGSFGSRILLFLLVPLYTNLLTEEEYGIGDLVFTTAQLLLPVVSLAIFNGLVRYGLVKEYKKEDAFFCSTIVFLLGSIFCICATPALQLYNPVSEWKWYLCSYVIVLFASSNILNYLKVKDSNKLYSVLSILHAMLLVIFNLIFLAGLQLGVQGYLLSSIISSAIIALLGFFINRMYLDLHNASYNSILMRKMLVYSIPFILNDISWWIIHSSDKIMIEWMMNASVLGIYTAAAKLPALINVFSSVFTQAWRLSSIKEYDDSNDKLFYSKVFQYFTIFIFGICICIVSVVKPFMNIYVGQAFFSAWQYVPLLLVGATFSAISAFAGSLYGAMEKSKSIMTTTFISGLINIFVNLLLIPICGVWGAVIGTVVSYVLVAILRLWDVHRYIEIDYHIKNLSLLSLLSIIEAVLVGVDFHIVITSFISIILYLFIVYKDLVPMIALLKKVNQNKKGY